MDQNKTAQLKACREYASAGRLQELCWYAESRQGRKTQSIIYMQGDEPTLPVVPVVLQPSLYRPADWQVWFDLTRFLAEKLCEHMQGTDRMLIPYPALAFYGSLHDRKWHYREWEPDDTICAHCGAINAEKQAFSLNNGVFVKYCAICLENS